MSRVVVLDYGSGNVRSAVRALERVGADVELTADPKAAVEADGLVVPGVGAFAACMAGLHEVQAHHILTERVQAGRPVLGICVGMQVLFSSGIEHGVQTPGLDVLPGRVERLNAPVIPHMGWNTVRPPVGSVLFDGVEPDTRFYFVHSYAVHPSPEQAGYAATLAEHGEDFVAAVEAGPVSATQFHPEKSGDAGAQLLANWLGVL
ncbi:MAG: imidazole glycerol phosphate synthase subunit HisH [Jatrophihabitantaceae bacterium]